MRKVIKTVDPRNYMPTLMTGVIYGNANIPIKKQKVVIRETPTKIKTKTVDYSPISYYGKQKRTVTKTTVRK